MRRVTLALGTFALLLTACAKDDESVDDSDSDSDADADPLTWDDVSPTFNSVCKNCHVNSTSGGLNISGYAAIVNAPSSVSGYDYIEPGSLDDSYLWRKLQGTHTEVGGTGGQMPKAGSVSGSQMDDIESWIVDGALE